MSLFDTPLPFRDETFILRSARPLGYAIYGDPNGRPVFWFHGTPGSRLQLPPDAPALARRRGFQIIGVDRPGIGNSMHDPNRTLLSWADDIAQLADHLGHDRFALIGLSGGGPYVLSTAYSLPERVVAGASLGGIGPPSGVDDAPGIDETLQRLMKLSAHVKAPLATLLSGMIQPLRPLALTGIDIYAKVGPSSDRPIFERPAFRRMFAYDIVTATHFGIRGPVYDIALFGAPWGFYPKDITVPIRFWHGDKDQIVPLSNSEYLAGRVPDSELYVQPGLGHFAGFASVADVLDKLLDLWENGSPNAPAGTDTAIIDATTGPTNNTPSTSGPDATSSAATTKPRTIEPTNSAARSEPTQAARHAGEIAQPAPTDAVPHTSKPGPRSEKPSPCSHKNAPYSRPPSALGHSPISRHIPRRG